MEKNLSLDELRSLWYKRLQMKHLMSGDGYGNERLQVKHLMSDGGWVNVSPGEALDERRWLG